MPDLSTWYLGLELRTPLVASSSPLTRDLDSLRRLEDHGASAVVLPSLFEEDITAGALAVHRALEAGTDSFAEATEFLVAHPDYLPGPERHLELVSAARRALSIPVIASLNGVTPGGWLEYARGIEQAGAHALELNLYTVAADPALSSAMIEARDLEMVDAVRSQVRIPLAVKLSPYFTGLAHFAQKLMDAGVDGLVLFNRFYQPELDLATLDVIPKVVLSRSEELRLPLRWIGILRGRTKASLAATSGVHTGVDVVKAVLAGADAAMLASALLERGPAHLEQVERELRVWLEEREYESIRQMKGSLSQHRSPDPEAFERANYLRTLRSFSAPSHASTV
jgi:dihydroorotate dehydrogenase (fumarate)